jgi:hypothetical protein
MKKIKEEKGITLIALIITIIVMLILVMVTVAFAMNGGLFKNAKEASAETERKAIGETILGSYVLNDSGILNIKSTAGNAKEALKTQGYKAGDIKITYSDGTYANNLLSGKIIASNDSNINSSPDADWAVIQVNAKTGVYYYELTKKPTTTELIKGEDEEGNTILTGGENTYNVSEEDEITIEGGSSGTGEGANEEKMYDLLADYILGPEDGEGNRPGRNFFGIFDFDTYGFIYYTGDEDQETYQNVKFADLDDVNMRIYLRYFGDIYYFSLIEGSNESMITTGLTLSQDNQGNLGKYVQFSSDNNTNWIVLSEDGNTVELISADAIGNVELSGKSGYNNAIDTLVTACQDLVKDNGQYISSSISGARCIGGPATDETETLDENGYKALDTYYLSDYNKMDTLKICGPDNGLGSIYWVASRCKNQRTLFNKGLDI